MNFKLTISYDGSSFSGWQTQPIERTIQSELERVICNTFNKDNIKLYGSGLILMQVQIPFQKN